MPKRQTVRSRNMWESIKQDRIKHLQMLREALEKEAKQEKLTK